MGRGPEQLFTREGEEGGGGRYDELLKQQQQLVARQAGATSLTSFTSVMMRRGADPKQMA